MAPRIALVSCVKTKRPTRSPAGDLYISPLFKGLRAYATANADSWYVLSAEHGLLRPDEPVDPYERTLNGMPRSARLEWARRVHAQMLATLPAGAEIVMLAGVNYRADIVPFLRSHGFSVTIPFEGLPFGKQLQKLKLLAERGYRDV